MAILHEYVPSSENDGYYIYDAYDGRNITYQVSAFARDVLEILDSCAVEEKVPPEVFHTLRGLDLIYTGETGVETYNELIDIPTNGQPKRLPASEREIFFESLLSRNDLDVDERENIQNYVEKNQIENSTEANSQAEWAPEPPHSDSYQGRVARTFQDDEWGFIETRTDDVDEDVFFHQSMFEDMSLKTNMRVEFSYQPTSEGLEITHVKPLTDALGRKLKDRNSQDLDSDTEPRDDSTVGISELSVGDYVEAKIDHAKGKKGIGTKGYLHIHHRRGSGAQYIHISSKGNPVPVNKWVVVKIMEVNQGHAMAKMKSPPENIDPPLYMP
ncbi:cold-shock protein [Halosimplex pelagicum]|uniref:Cold shock domain-containing protein n=1 Tax=Halosimplex pelagicum TaxID=869886 RepID=A0A7D5SWD3_9EURY|nr:cold shock domain-containing protein [Halosimplex pelagicum]QLH83007.1 cold shock domain-containing protein [Halosimplex pelagicum]